MLKINIPIKFEDKSLFSVIVKFKKSESTHNKSYFLIAKNEDVVREYVKQEYSVDVNIDCEIELVEKHIKEIVNV